MNTKQVIKQSKAAYGQWKDIWRKHAKAAAKQDMKPMHDFANIGIGRACVLVANGYSFEREIETLKKYQDNVDIIACDKTLGHLLDNGIKPTYCMVCDANVNYEKYMKPWEDQLDQTVLFQNVCANPKWYENGNWKDKYFFVNKDVMNYEREFSKLSGCANFLTAGTNVSNMMLVLLNQSENGKVQNYFGYDKLILLGYDYSWLPDGKYYAFDKEADGKFYYMRHIYGINTNGKLVFTSNNLSNSSSWVARYIKAFKVNCVNCSTDSIGELGRRGTLEEQIQYRHKPSDADLVREMLKELKGIESRRSLLQNELRNIGREHWYASQSL